MSEIKVCFISGSTRGIGKAIALRMASAGIMPVITGRNAEVVEKVASEIKDKTGMTAAGYPLDVSSFDDCGSVMENVNKTFGKIDFMVNNAGITRDMIFMRMKEEDWDQVININLKGVFNCCRAAIKGMVRKKYGRIINITSLVGVSGNAGQANYAASKAGVIGFTKSLAMEYSKKGITVNAVAPGYIETDMTEGLSELIKEEVVKSIPAGKFGTVEDIAGCVEFLISDAASYITGQTIHVNGGMLMP